jgi:hypothetical protein
VLFSLGVGGHILFHVYMKEKPCIYIYIYNVIFWNYMRPKMDMCESHVRYMQAQTAVTLDVLWLSVLLAGFVRA